MEKTKLEIRKMILLLAKEKLMQLIREKEIAIETIERGEGNKYSNLEREKKVLSDWKATSEEVEIWKKEVFRLL